MGKAKEKPKPQVFQSDDEACLADVNGQQLYRLKLKGTERFVIAAVSPQEAKAAYVDHLGGTVERMSDKDKLNAARKALATLRSQQKLDPAT